MKFRNIISALFLILYIPKIVYMYVRENVRMIIAVMSVVFILALVSYCRGGSNVSKYVNVEMPQITDLTAAFATGEKRAYDVELIAIHHTAGNPNCGVNDICKVHFGERQWGKIGYHFFIDKDGNIFQLRPLEERVPHAYGCNDNAIAICLSGNFSQYEVPQAQWQSAIRLTRWLMLKYHLVRDNVMKHSELTKYSLLNNTECAGTKFNMDKFRNEL